MMKSKKILGISYAVFSAVIYGSQPLFTRILGAEGISTFSIVLIRSIIAAVILTILCITNGKAKIEKNYLFFLVLAGTLGSSLTSLFLFSAFLYIPSGMASSIHYLYPAMVLLFSVLFGKECLSPLKIGCLLLATTGVSILYVRNFAINAFGVLLAILSALSFALYTVTVSYSRLKTIDPIQLSLGCAIVSSVILLPITLASKALTVPSTVRQWLFLAILAVSVSIVALLLYKKSTEYLGASKASIFSTFEPVTSLSIGYLYFNESVTARALIGILMILSATIILCFDKNPN